VIMIPTPTYLGFPFCLPKHVPLYIDSCSKSSKATACAVGCTQVLSSAPVWKNGTATSRDVALSGCGRYFQGLTSLNADSPRDRNERPICAKGRVLLEVSLAIDTKKSNHSGAGATAPAPK